jgi:RNA polymerase sigma-70 factor (ECF subfamily)
VEREAKEDAVLIAAAREGDVDAFADLVRRYEHRVRVVLYRLLEDERDVDEATQDTFIRAWRSLDRFRGDAALFTWLYRIAVNEALMRLRRKHLPISELSDETEAASKDEPPIAAEAGELLAFLTERLRALPLEYRVPLVLRDVLGLSNEEVADILELSLSAAKSRIHRARMQIRAELDDWERRT